MSLKLKQMIRQNTVLRAPSLCPEITLHLLRPDAEIWVGTVDCPNPPTPFWGIAWGAGQALARWILDHPGAVWGLSVLDLGAGSGIAAIAACKAGATDVTAVDCDAAAIQAVQMNAEQNGVTISARCESIESVLGETTDVILACDLGYAIPGIVDLMQSYVAGGAVVLIAEPERRGVDLSAGNVVGQYEIRAEPATEAFNIRRAVVIRLEPV